MEILAPADWARKLPAVLWGTATVGILALLITRRAGKTAGIITALFLLLAPFHVRYSQEFRPYSVGLFLLCLALLCLDRLLERPGAVRLLAFYLVCLATAYALYLAAAVLAIAAGALVVEDAFSEDPVRRRSARRFLLLSPLFAGSLFLAYLPWWPVVLEAAHRAPMAPRAPVTASRLGEILSFFSLAAGEARAGNLSDAPILLLAAAGTWICLKKRRMRFLLVWGLGGFALIEAAGQIHPHFDTPNHFLPAGLAIPALAAMPLAAVGNSRPWPRMSPALVVLLLEAWSLAGYFREGRADWRPLARFLRARPKVERIFTENQYSELCVAFYVEGPEWLYRGGRLGRDVWNLDGEIVRLTWSWKPGTTAWLIIAGEPRHEALRRWARAFPLSSFPTAEGAVLYRLDPKLRDSALQ